MADHICIPHNLLSYGIFDISIYFVLNGQTVQLVFFLHKMYIFSQWNSPVVPWLRYIIEFCSASQVINHTWKLPENSSYLVGSSFPLGIHQIQGEGWTAVFAISAAFSMSGVWPKSRCENRAPMAPALVLGAVASGGLGQCFKVLPKANQPTGVWSPQLKACPYICMGWAMTTFR